MLLCSQQLWPLKSFSTYHFVETWVVIVEILRVLTINQRFESALTSVIIASFDGKSTFNANIQHRLSTKRKCHVMLMTNQRQELRCQAAKLQGHSQHIYTRPQRHVIILYVIMFQIHSLTDERFIDVGWEYPDIYQRPLVEFRDKNKLSIYVPLPWLFWNSLLKQAETPLDTLTVTIDIIMLSTFNALIWWIVLQPIRVSIEISEATKTLNQNFYPRPDLRLPNCSHAQFQYKSVITKARQPEFLVEIGDWITTVTTMWKHNCCNWVKDNCRVNHNNYNFTEIRREVDGS